MLRFDAKKNFHSNATGLQFELTVQVTTYADNKAKTKKMIADLMEIPKKEVSFINAEDFIDEDGKDEGFFPDHNLEGLIVKAPDYAKEINNIINSLESLFNHEIYSIFIFLEEISLKRKYLTFTLRKEIDTEEDNLQTLLVTVKTDHSEDTDIPEIIAEIASIADCDEDLISYKADEEHLIGDPSPLSPEYQGYDNTPSPSMTENLVDNLYQINGIIHATATIIEQ